MQVSRRPARPSGGSPPPTLIGQPPASPPTDRGSVAHDRRFRFGIQLHRPLDGSTWLDSGPTRRGASATSTLFVPDHFGDQLKPLTALASAAAVTKTLNVGALFDNDYRHPLVLAKEIATLDAISNGRVEFGLGAELDAHHRCRVRHRLRRTGDTRERFMEGVDVIRGVWSGEPFDHAGTHYRITAHSGLPVPVTAGGPRPTAVDRRGCSAMPGERRHRGRQPVDSLRGHRRGRSTRCGRRPVRPQGRLGSRVR